MTYSGDRTTSSLLAALGIVFVAEVGDKTQLVALGFGARHRVVPVLVGVAAAYVAAMTLSVLVGGLVGAAFPADLVGIAGGVLFLGFAVWALRSNGADESEEFSAAPGGNWRIVASVAVAMFVAELGDKTMLATATSAARDNPVLVWIGATVGIILAGSVGVLTGRVLGARLPARAVRIGSAVLFAVFGVILIGVSV